MKKLANNSLSLWKRAVLAGIALAAATALWLPTVHVFFEPAASDFRAEKGVPPLARALAARHVELWENSDKRARELARMRTTNAEWDFMGRTFLVMALGDMALREPEKKGRYLGVMDAIIDETLRIEQTQGMYAFLMDYAKARPYQAQPARSTFLDSEIAMMLAVRQVVEPQARFVTPLAQRVDTMIAYMEQVPAMCGESYPDECWVFDNALGVAAVKVSDYVDGRDHGAFVARWVAHAKGHLVDAKSGMLVSSLTYDGVPMDGPEGSSIWLIAHCLKVIDVGWARDQFGRARAGMGRDVAGLGYAREWPGGWSEPADVDSGPIVPGLGASAGSSGLAVLGAASFGDEAYLRTLMASLNFAAFPMWSKGELMYGASNQVGDAVLLYALVQGPVWERVMEGKR